MEKAWDTLINPECAIANSFVHKITDVDVAQAPTFPDIANTVASLLAGRTMLLLSNAIYSRNSHASGWSGQPMATGLLIPKS